MNQQPLSRLERGALSKREKRGVIDHWKRRRFGKPHSAGNGKRAVRSAQRLLSEGVTVRHRQHAVARFELGHAGANGVYSTGNFGAWRKRERRLDLILALDLQDVEKIQRCRMIADSDFAWAWLG